jgi:hypothetical protein
VTCLSAILFDRTHDCPTKPPGTTRKKLSPYNLLSEEASRRAREAASQLPDSSYNFAELVTGATTKN